MTIEKGQRVRIGRRDAAVLERVHNNQSCLWHPKMEQYIDKVGIVDGISESGHVRVCYFEKYNRPSHANIPHATRMERGVVQVKWTLLAQALLPSHQLSFCAGDHVIVTGDEERLKAAEVDRKIQEKLATVTTSVGADSVAFVAIDQPLPYSMSTEFLFPVYVKNEIYRDPQYGSTQNDSIERLLFNHVQPISVEHMRKFSEAARKGDEKFIVQFLRDYSEHINEPLSENDRKTALMLASEMGHHRVCMLLLIAGAHWYKKHPIDGNTCIHLAVIHGRKDTLKTLLTSFTADVNVKNSQGETPLHCAVAVGNLPCTELLLNHSDINVNLQDNRGNTVLHKVVEMGNDKLVDVLLNCPTLEPWKSNRDGFMPIHTAAMAGNNKAVELVLSRKPELATYTKPDGLTALHLAATNGHCYIVKTILTIPCVDVHVCSNDGRNALHWAATWMCQSSYREEKLTIIRSLIDAGVDVNAVDRPQRDTPLHLAMQSLNDALQKKMDLPDIHLITQMKNLNPDNFEHDHVASSCRSWPQLAAICYLVHSGASLVQKNALGKTPIDICSSSILNNIWLELKRTFNSGHSSSADNSFELSDDLCVVGFCNESPADVCFLPCGHKTMCQICVKKVPIKKCPKCSIKIEKCVDSDGEEIMPGESEGATAISNVDELPACKEMKAKVEELENAVTCVICMDRRLSVVFDCGHMSCYICANTLRACHICRKKIYKRTPIYANWS